MPSSTHATERRVAVGVPVPGLGLLTYRVPEGMRVPPKGARVGVPLGSRSVVGVVVGEAEPAPGDAALRDVQEALDAASFLPPLIVDLALWAGEYYAAGPGDALAVAMPPASRRSNRPAFKTARAAQLDVAAADRFATRSDQQREAIAILRQSAAPLTLSELLQRGVKTAAVRSLARRGVVQLTSRLVERDPFAASLPEEAGRIWTVDNAIAPNRELTIEQQDALAQLSESADSARFETVLLHGVTGSGKTEVYLQLAGRVLESGRRVLVLVPEIGLTPAVAGVFRSRFGAQVAIQHSGLSDGERHDQWQRIRAGAIGVVVGTRSAVFTPLENVGLVIVDEEHDGAYKQQDAPRYHGRDVAIVRGRLEGALVVLGTATPSLESAANAQSGRYRRVVLTRRILDRPLASVEVVDMRAEYADQGPATILSRVLIREMEGRLEQREQTLILLNRRGYATVVFCRQCAATMECPHCSVALTYHRAARRVRCHYCNYAAALPRRCGICGGEYLEQSGFGTERIEADVRARFPGARVARVDRDTVRGRGAMARVLRGVAAGAIDVLVGTQMIAKGHDFPSVTLVGVVSADVGLGLADFRAAERTFQLLTQVVGRAGRGATPGHAVVQTLYPMHYSIRAAAAQDYAAFFEREMEFRTHMHYPPAIALINVVVKGRTIEAAMADASALVAAFRAMKPAARAIGPAPAALSKVKDEYRAQFLVKGSHRTRMREALQAALESRPDLKRRVLVDVDPMNVL